MLKPTFTKLFKKQFKLMEKRGLDMNKLRTAIDIIINEQLLPPERRNHMLHGEWNGALECHIQGDWVLIYEINPIANTVIFHRTGSHSDLF